MSQGKQMFIKVVYIIKFYRKTEFRLGRGDAILYLWLYQRYVSVTCQTYVNNICCHISINPEHD